MVKNQGKCHSGKSEQPPARKKPFPDPGRRPAPPPRQGSRRSDRSTGPIGPFVRHARLETDPEGRGQYRDGREPARGGKHWQPTSHNVNVASVVASLDSATMIGATASIRPARKPHAGPHMRRPMPQISRHVAEPATPETSRAPNGVSPASAVHRPISQ